MVRIPFGWRSSHWPLRREARLLAAMAAAALLLLSWLSNPPAIAAQAGPCQAADLSAVAVLQGATGALAGSIVFTNQSAAACTLEGRPGVEVEDANGQALSATPVAGSGATGEMIPTLVALQPGQTATAFVVWRNFCGPQSVAPLAFRVTLPDAQGTLTAVVTGPPGGTPLSITPRCDSPSSPSTISVGPFEQIGRVGEATPTVLPKTGGMPLPLAPAAIAMVAVGMGVLLRRLASR